MVGGYANAASWASARASGSGYDTWVSLRLQRLVRPVAPFVLVWCALGFVARWLGLGRGIVQDGSQVAFIPTWFLAVYILVVLLAPAMHALWVRFGMTSFWALALGAAVVDAVAHGTGVDQVRWINYALVWLALHQVGFAWRDGTLSEPRRAFSFALGGLTALVVLRGLACYPVSMVTVPGEPAANSNPPTLALLALGVTHAGIALAMEAPARRLLERAALWTFTVFVNGVIMSLYLWHATVMILVVAIAELPGGIGLRFVPNSATWWASRPLWLLALGVVLAGFVAVFGRFEGPPRGGAAPTPAWRSVPGALAVCVGLLGLAAAGIGSRGVFGVRIWPVLVALVGILFVAGGRSSDGYPSSGLPAGGGSGHGP